MQLKIGVPASEKEHLRQRALRRMLAVARHLGTQAPRPKVALTGAQGAHGVDKRCQIELEVRNAPAVRITTVARDWRSAVDLAVNRACRLMLESLRQRASLMAKMRPVSRATRHRLRGHSQLAPRPWFDPLQSPMPRFNR